MVILVILAFAVIVALQVPPLVKKKYIKELVAFSVFLFLGFVLMLLLVLGVQLPSPTEAVMKLFDALNWHF